MEIASSSSSVNQTPLAKKVANFNIGLSFDDDEEDDDFITSPTGRATGVNGNPRASSDIDASDDKQFEDHTSSENEKSSFKFKRPTTHQHESSDIEGSVNNTINLGDSEQSDFETSRVSKRKSSDDDDDREESIQPPSKKFITRKQIVFSDSDDSESEARTEIVNSGERKHDGTVILTCPIS